MMFWSTGKKVDNKSLNSSGASCFSAEMNVEDLGTNVSASASDLL
jgi:hypothetical protein